MSEFDTAKQIGQTLQTPDGAKHITVRFPTDEEIIDRQRKRKLITKSLGRGLSQSRVPNAEAVDGELLRKIRIDEGDPIDDYEAVFIVDQLMEADVDGVEPEGSAYRVFLRVPGGMTEHLVGMLSARDIMQFGRNYISSVDGPYSQQIITINLSAAVEPYDRLIKESKGYASPVPVHHKAEVIKAVAEAVKSGLGVAEAANFQLSGQNTRPSDT